MDDIRKEMTIGDIDIITKAMPISDERKLYLQIMATTLEGRCLEKFIIFN